MSADPRAALAVLTAALERHLEACAYKHGENDPAVIIAADALADAFDSYDEALLEAYGEVTPLEIYDGDDDDDDDYDDDDGEDDFDEDDLDPDSDDDFDDHLEGDDALQR